MLPHSFTQRSLPLSHIILRREKNPAQLVSYAVQYDELKHPMHPQEIVCPVVPVGIISLETITWEAITALSGIRMNPLGMFLSAI